MRHAATAAVALPAVPAAVQPRRLRRAARVEHAGVLALRVVQMAGAQRACDAAAMVVLNVA